MKALVTGGGGFLGKAIASKLRARGDEVRSYSRGRYDDLAAMGVEHASGEIDDAAKLASAACGADVVFHVAAKPGIWGSKKEFERVNVGGTIAVVDACKRAGVRRLVYTSSPSVVFNGKDMQGADESVPYPRHFEADYPRTKAEAERYVLAENSDSLQTTALRPHLLWGPGDNHLVPRLVARGRAGRLRRIGRRRCLIDACYIDNAADAHLLAADRLTSGSPIAGRAYFIAQGEPVDLWEFVDRILSLAGVPPIRKTIPSWAAWAAGAAFEAVYKTLGLKSEPRMTRFVAREMSTSHWFDLTAARRDLGYSPAVSIDEGLRRLGKWIQEAGI